MSFNITLAIAKDNILKPTNLFFATSDNGATTDTSSTASRDETTLTTFTHTGVKRLLNTKPNTRGIELKIYIPSGQEARHVGTSRHGQCAGGYHHHGGAPQGSWRHRGPWASNFVSPCTCDTPCRLSASVCRGVHHQQRYQRWHGSYMCCSEAGQFVLYRAKKGWRYVCVALCCPETGLVESKTTYSAGMVFFMPDGRRICVVLLSSICVITVA